MCLFFALLSPVPISAQEKLLPVFHFSRLTTADGLPSNEIRSNVVTDRQGFVWVGTVNGLARYDGHTCKVYRTIPGDPHSISSNGITSIFLDSRGLLWIGTWETGLSLYDALRDRFTNFLPRGKDTTLLGLGAILMIHEDPAGNIWGSSYENKIILADMSGLLNETNVDSVAASVHFQIFRLEGSKDVVYLGDWDRETLLFGTARGLFTYNRPTRQIARFSVPPVSGVSLDTVRIVSFWWESPNRLWIATRGHGLYLFDRSSGSLKGFHKRPAGGKESRDDLMRDAVIDRSGRLWITTITTLDLFDPVIGAYKEYLISSVDPPRTPYLLSIDRTGRLWVSTMDDGLFVLTPRSLRFPHYALRGVNGRAKAMETIEDAGNGSYWIATEGKVIRLQLSDLHVLQTVDLFRGEKPNYWRAGVLDSYRDEKGIIWYGTWGLGLYSFEPASGKVRNFRSSTQLPGLTHKEDVCWSIAGGEHDSLWIAGNRDGLLQFDTRTRTFSKRAIAGDLPLVNVAHVLKDNYGKLWISDETQGVTALDPATDNVEHFTHDPDRPTSISHNIARYTYQDPVGRIWIGTRELNLWNPESRSFTRLPNAAFEDPLYVMPMGTDSQGKLWIYYGGRGVGILDPKTHSFANFGGSDGLCANIYEMSHLQDGRVLLLGLGGMNVISPESLSTAHPPPPLVLTRISINDSVHVPVQSLSAAVPLQLRYDQNVLEFEFAVIDPGAGHLVEYRYRLEGLEETWVRPAGRRFVRYPGLSPGRYVFRVRAASIRGYWPDQEIGFALCIAPPWWSSWWAYTLYGILVVGSLYAVYRARLRQLHLRQRAEMEHFQAERLAEVDKLKSRFFANISHEFRTPLTLILGPAEQGMDATGESSTREKFQLIRDNARKLLALVSQLLEFSHVESGMMRLQASRSDIVQFIRRTVMSFESWAERKKIDLAFHCDTESADVLFDEDKLEKILNNLVSNALKFTPEGGTVRVSARTEGVPGPGFVRQIAVTVADTGSGISAEHLPHIFDRFYRVDAADTIDGTGIGLALTKDLVELHHGSISVESNPGEGTFFVLTLPVDESAYRREEIALNPFHVERSRNAPAYVPSERPAGIPTTAPASGKLIVLIVEDNDDLRRYVREYLEVDYAVYEAPNGKAGFDRAMELVPDIVISDVMMPRLDGIALCRLLKQDLRTSHVPVILLTARAGTESKIEGLETGADDYITKPFDLKELRARVRNLIEQRQELRKKFSGGAVLRPGEVTVTSVDDALLKKAMAVVEKHMRDGNFSVDDLARELCLSRATLNRKLNALTDLSPAEFIRYLRLQRARELLEKNAGSVGDIACEVGFSSPSHFSALFHERFGVSPSEIAQKNG